MLRSLESNYLGRKRGSHYGNDDMLNHAANEMIRMKEYGIHGNYQTAFYPYPAPNKYLNSYYSSFGESWPVGPGGNIYLDMMGIHGNYQTAFYPYPAPNVNNPDFNAFGNRVVRKRKKTKSTRKKRKSTRKKTIRKKYK